MTNSFDPVKNWQETRTKVGYLNRSDATDQTYADLGFICGLEIHQQLATEKKLFCRCPVGIFQDPDDFDAEVIRHMRPTLSEMGEYDGTALMEKRTRKNIVYRLKGVTACTYEIDDTPPFPLNQQALDISIEIALLLKSNVVGELHITRKQYLDGSIPTGFQRTAIVGVGGEIKLRHKTVRMIQLSLEEDACREVSDIGHLRIYRTDRLGIPLIEMVTHPEMVTPEEAMEAGNYLRYLSRSSGKVRTGLGAARQDVNVSITGGTRVEIKGVAHIKWIPRLTHIEAYRQKALLTIKDRLKQAGLKADRWKVKSKIHDPDKISFDTSGLFGVVSEKDQIAVVRLPGFHGLLSHFTQPGHSFANELSDRLKVIACLEKPNMVHTESTNPEIDPAALRKLCGADNSDAVVIIRGDMTDISEGIAVIKERCLMAFDGVPNETRKSLANGTTIFERVLPGPDRMYPDTDSAPIGILQDRVDSIQVGLATEVAVFRNMLDDWKVAPDAQAFLLHRGLVMTIKECSDKTGLSPRWLGHWFGHRIKHLENKYRPAQVKYRDLIGLIEHIHTHGLDLEIAKRVAPLMYQYPAGTIQEQFDRIEFKSTEPSELVKLAARHNNHFEQFHRSDRDSAHWRWLMGRLAPSAVGNVRMSSFSKSVMDEVTNG